MTDEPGRTPCRCNAYPGEHPAGVGRCARRQRDGDQPLPIGNDRPGTHDVLIDQLRDRRELGLARYGQLLQPHNGRDTGRDLVEELLDGAVYAQTLAVELADLEAALLSLVTVWAMEPGDEKLAAMRAAMTEAGALLESRRVPF